MEEDDEAADRLKNEERRIIRVDRMDCREVERRDSRCVEAGAATPIPDDAAPEFDRNERLVERRPKRPFSSSVD